MDDDRRQVLKRFSSHVRACVDQAAAFRKLFGDLEQAHLQGQPVQADLNAVFDESDALVVVARLNVNDNLEGALEDAVEHGFLQPTDREAFDGLWDDIDWIAPGIQAFELERAGSPHYWTGKTIGFDTVQGELVVEHTLTYGVDTVHRLRVPAELFFIDSVQRLQKVSQILPRAIQKEDLTPEDLGRILNTQSDLKEVLEQLGQVAPDDLGEQEQTDWTGDDVAQELATMFGEAPGDEGESDSDERTGRDDASLGFE